MIYVPILFIFFLVWNICFLSFNFIYYLKWFGCLFKTFLMHFLYVPGSFSKNNLRATCAMRLFQSVVDEQLIQNTTGHRSLAVRSYKRSWVEQEKEVSSIIQGVKRPCVVSISAPVCTSSMVQPATIYYIKFCNSILKQEYHIMWGSCFISFCTILLQFNGITIQCGWASCPPHHECLHYFVTVLWC